MKRDGNGYLVFMGLATLVLIVLEAYVLQGIHQEVRNLKATVEACSLR